MWRIGQRRWSRRRHHFLAISGGGEQKTKGEQSEHGTGAHAPVSLSSGRQGAGALESAGQR